MLNDVWFVSADNTKWVKTTLKGEGGLLGILPTFFDLTCESHDSLLDLQKTFGNKVLSPIHRATLLRECWSEGKTIFEYAPESRSAAEYHALTSLTLKY